MGEGQPGGLYGERANVVGMSRPNASDQSATRAVMETLATITARESASVRCSRGLNFLAITKNAQLSETRVVYRQGSSARAVGMREIVGARELVGHDHAPSVDDELAGLGGFQ